MVGRALDDGVEPRYRGLSLPKPVLGYERVRRRQRVFVTEGPFDWLTAVSWDLPTCALLGTQVRAGGLRFLDRARSVVFVLDSDEAGRDAAEQLAAAMGDRATVLRLPDGVKDLNELGAAEGGREAFFQVLDEAQDERRRERADVASTP
jgi:DNA primase